MGGFFEVHFPLRSGNAHEQIRILDRDPTGEYFHSIFKIGRE